MDTLKGPDFPTGGQLIYDQKALEAVYRTGRGSLKVRGRWRYVKEEHLVEIYEIPYSTTVEAIIDKVTELVKAGRSGRSQTCGTRPTCPASSWPST